MHCSGKGSSGNFNLPLRSKNERFKLTHLQFHWSDDDRSLWILSWLLRLCPDLKFFATTVESYRDIGRQLILDLVNRSCPSLRQSQMVKMEHIQNYPELCFTESNDRNLVAVTGIPCLKNELMPMLSRQQSNLEALRLDLCHTIHTNEVLERIASMGGFKQLREIDLAEKDLAFARQYIVSEEHNEHDGFLSDDKSDYESDYDSDSNRGSDDDQTDDKAEEIASIIRRCFSLEAARLVDFKLNDNVLEGLGNLKHPRHLELLACENIAPPALNQFFQRNADLGVFTYKQVRRPRFGPGLHWGKVLRVISGSPHKTLTELRLLNCRTTCIQDLANFVKCMQNSRLSRVVCVESPITQ